MEKRYVGLDLLRVISMMGIIGLHIINKGGILENTNLFSTSYFITSFIFSILYLSVDIFAITSGFLLYNKKIKYNRIVELIFIILFWSFLITTIFYSFNFFNIRQAGLKELIVSFFPFLIGRYWYITAYVFLFFLIPYINKLIDTLSNQDHKKLCLLLLVFLSVIPVFFLERDLFITNGGLSPIWLIFCYILGAYIGKNKENYKNNYIGLTITLLIIAFASNILTRYLTYRIFGKILLKNLFIDHISPFTVVSSCLVIISFVNIKNVRLYSIIKYLSNSSFAVYIIHSHYLVYEYLINNNFSFLVNYNPFLLFALIPGICFIIYVICTLLDEVRKLLFKLLKIDFLINKIAIFIDRFC